MQNVKRYHHSQNKIALSSSNIYLRSISLRLCLEIIFVKVHNLLLHMPQHKICLILKVRNRITFTHYATLLYTMVKICKRKKSQSLFTYFSTSSTFPACAVITDMTVHIRFSASPQIKLLSE